MVIYRRRQYLRVPLSPDTQTDMIWQESRPHRRSRMHIPQHTSTHRLTHRIIPRPTHTTTAHPPLSEPDMYLDLAQLAKLHLIVNEKSPSPLDSEKPSGIQAINPVPPVNHLMDPPVHLPGRANSSPHSPRLSGGHRRIMRRPIPDLIPLTHHLSRQKTNNRLVKLILPPTITSLNQMQVRAEFHLPV